MLEWQIAALSADQVADPAKRHDCGRIIDKIEMLNRRPPNMMRMANAG